ncbi:hypothetical protein [Pseudobacillus wudalianchiensis]|uniref:Uncharacterized protein n=1 Tax=Pseudobacillus wudalianchiensis TaxID=1743143 RepID=A0A1B9ATS9_9BACI|nr:hypothetical protein [Bacillus wudalianchiensis]OCA87306.1 hypothetical protein A8F95_08645 [Bacillus wudalianchiensis]
MKYIKLLIMICMIFSITFIGFNSVHAKEKKLSGISVVTNKKHPRYCDSVKKFKKYGKKVKEDLVTIGQYEYNDKSVLHVDDSDDECVNDIEIYIDHTKKKRISDKKALKIIKSYLPKKKKLEKYYESPETKRLIDTDENLTYYVISYHHKDYYNNNPENYPGNIHAYTESDEKGVKLIRISWTTPKHFMNYEKIE